MLKAIEMRAMVLAVVVLVAGVGPALAGAHGKPAASDFTTLDRCAAEGRGVPLGDDGVCLKVTGGVTYWQSWGNAVGGTDDGEPGGMPIVTTPAGTYTIPAPR